MHNGRHCWEAGSQVITSHIAPAQDNTSSFPAKGDWLQGSIWNTVRNANVISKAPSASVIVLPKKGFNGRNGLYLLLLVLVVFTADQTSADEAAWCKQSSKCLAGVLKEATPVFPMENLRIHMNFH